MISCKGSSRRENTLNKLRSKGLTKISIYEVEKDKENGERGCWTSHRQLLRDAKASGIREVLVLEDDAILTRDWANVLETLDTATRRLEKIDPAWQYLTLGSLLLNSDPIGEGLRHVNCAVGGAAYVCNTTNHVDLPDYGKANTRYVDFEMFCKGPPEPGGTGLINMVASLLTHPKKDTHNYALKDTLFVPDAEADSEIGHVESTFWKLSSEENMDTWNWLSENQWGFGLAAFTWLVAFLIEWGKLRANATVEGKERNKVLTVIASFFALDRLYLGQWVMGSLKIILGVAAAVLLLSAGDNDNGWYGIFLLVAFILFWFIDQTKVYSNAFLMSPYSPHGKLVVFNSLLAEARIAAVVLSIALVFLLVIPR